MKKLNELKRLKLVLPLQTISYKNQSSLTDSVRKAIYDFFIDAIEDSSLMETLSWFLFKEYEKEPSEIYTLSHHPSLGIGSGEIQLTRSLMRGDYTLITLVDRYF